MERTTLSRSLLTSWKTERRKMGSGHLTEKQGRGIEKTHRGLWKKTYN